MAEISDGVKQACLDHMARLHGYTGPVKLTLFTGTGPVEHDILPTCVVCNRQDGQHEDYCISAPEEDQ